MLAIYTIIHVAISVIAIVAGFIVVFGMLRTDPMEKATKIYLWMTAATSITGFFFPFHGFKPSYVLGVLTLIVLWLAYSARYKHSYAGGWRGTYVVSMVLALYFNMFVLIVQTFDKVPSLHVVPSGQMDPHQKTVQFACLVVFLFLAAIGLRSFRPRIAVSQ